MGIFFCLEKPPSATYLARWLEEDESLRSLRVEGNMDVVVVVGCVSTTVRH